MKGNGFVFNTMTLVIHPRDCVDITMCIMLIFDHLFGKTIGAGTGELSTSERKLSVELSTSERKCVCALYNDIDNSRS